MPINKIQQTTDALPNAVSGEWAYFKIVSNELKFNSDGSNTRTLVSTDQTQTLTGKTLTAPVLTAPVISGAATIATGSTITSPTLVTPALGVATATSVAATGAITSSGAGIGYTAGAGGIVTQATNKSTAVTLSKLSGDITMNGAALAADTTVAFTLTNTFIAAADTLVLLHVLTGTLGAYSFAAVPAAGSASISVHNLTPGSLSEAIVIRFAIIKAALT